MHTVPMTLTDSPALRRSLSAADPDWLRLAASAGAVGFWHLDAATGCIDSTPRCRAILGLEPDTNFTLDSIFTVIHPDDRERLNATVQQALETRASYSVEYRVLWPDGSTHWISTHGFYVELDGRSGLVGTTIEDTERKQMEDALRAASRERDEFLATVSHELRTPMTSILGWAQLLKTMELAPELRFAIEQIELGAKAQATIVDDLIDVSRAVTGKLRLQVARIDAVTVLNEAMQMVETTATAKRITLDRTVHCETATVFADRGRLHQVFWNLLSNAIKFTPVEGSVNVRMDCTSERLTVTFTDTGIGIAPEFLPYVFDRFSQQSGATTRQHGGLGLGLAIVKQLVEMHGGTVGASSEGAGKGATFRVELPR
jgi:PAS domain S-box-containing protein